LFQSDRFETLARIFLAEGKNLSTKKFHLLFPIVRQFTLGRSLARRYLTEEFFLETSNFTLLFGCVSFPHGIQNGQSGLSLSRKCTFFFHL
jgi:hypothetical protein